MNTETVLTIASVVIALVSAIESLRANRKSAAVASEQEQLRRLVRNDGVYGLIALYEMVGDLSTYVWMAAEKQRVDTNYVISFLTERLSELNRIHGSSAFFYWKRAVSTFQPDRPLSGEPLEEILGTKLLDSEFARRIVATSERGIGTYLAELEMNLWISTADALNRIKAPRDKIMDEEGATARDELGAEGAFVLKSLLHYFERCEVVTCLLRHYAPSISIHIKRSRWVD